MSEPDILHTKLFIPPTRPERVPRPRLIAQLDAGLHRTLTLISAPAGFGKTTLLTEWTHHLEEDSPVDSQVTNQIAWLSLDEGDNDPAHFLTYFITALNQIEGTETVFGKGALSVLQSPQSPPTKTILTSLINEIAAFSDKIILILDDYHLIEAKAIHDALRFFLENMPPQMHLVVATREDPPLPLARYRARSQLTELRATDLRFTPAEASQFLNQIMGLNLSADDIAALENRTEGWIAGLQLAALALRGPGTLSQQEDEDVSNFIQSFTGSHRYVLDYLLEEVLNQQPQSIQSFLLRTSILERLCGPLCDAVTGGAEGQETLEYLERSNLFIIPLDSERRWYRYHHLFAELLRQRLEHPPSHPLSSPPMGGKEGGKEELHIRASQWYEENGLAFEAFQHAAVANDVERAERLIAGDGIPLHYRGAVTTVLDWLASLPTSLLDARPLLRVRDATLSLVAGQTTGVEEKLQAAEAALAGVAADDTIRNLMGEIAAARATLALTQYQAETIIVQAHRALQHLNPGNMTFRFTAMWTLAFAYQLQGDRSAAGQALRDALSISQASGDNFSTILATVGLGDLQQAENQLHVAAATYRQALQLVGDQPLPNACEAHLGLARIFYQWNELDAAEQHGQQSLHLARQYEHVIDRFIISEVFLARLELARGDVAKATAMLAEASQIVRRHNFVQRMPEVAAAQVRALLRQGDLAAAANLAENHELPLSQARVHLAGGDPAAALAVLTPWRQQVETKDWQDERLKVTALQALAYQAHDETEKAVQLLAEALALAEPGGFIRLFVDEGVPMAQLLSRAAARGIRPDYVRALLAAFEAEDQIDRAHTVVTQPLVEPLSERELEVLALVAQGLSNREIGERLFIALSTVKTHNRNIFGKLQVDRRTEAVARARELGLL